MPSYQLEIQYKGTQYFGWQIQPNQKTIQGEINKSLQKISKSDNVYTLGSGRTDAKVHAFGQIARADIDLDIEENSLKRALNSLLPDDIRIIKSVKCSSSFQPVFHATSKIYEYIFIFGENPPPVHLREIISWSQKELDTKLMKKGCELFLGEHDFSNFYTTGTPTKSTIRNISKCGLDYIEADRFWSHSYDGAWRMEVEGNGFLKQMVRMIMGSLWSLGMKKISLGELEDAIYLKTKGKVGPVAPPNGLYLKKVFYS